MKKLFVLRRLLFLPLLCFFLLSGKLSGATQQERITLNLKEASITQFFKEIENRTTYKFFYKDSQVENAPLINVDVSNKTLIEVLNVVFEKTSLSYEITGNQIVIKQREVADKTIIKISGIVTDKNKEPLTGVTVVLTGTKRGVYTDGKGEFTLEVPVENRTSLNFRMIGMNDITIKLDGRTFYQVVLEETTLSLDEVVVTGIINKKADSFTGSAVTIRGDELERVGNQNIFQSLKNIDPSVYIMENVTMGSDPNTLPNMNMRGGTSFNESMGDANLKGNYQNKPNQPLFILNGFEVTAEKVFDMDMNTVESLTILKDASAKALYGSKAANGVVVIETKRLNATQPRVTYNGSLDLSMPDLSSYDVCNALEKLDVEFRENVYPDNNPASLANYYSLRKKVLEGLDTYWLSKPVQMGYGQKHSLIVELGKDELRTSLNIAHYDNQGVMKGSGRKTFSGGFDISYKLKKLRFQNSLSFTNNNSSDSPYGSFSTFTTLNPYLNPYDANGNLLATLSNGARNPMNDGIIGTSLTAKYFEITNNFLAEYEVITGLKLRARFGITKKTNSADRYYPVTHSKFASYGTDMASRKGQYEVNNGSRGTMAGDFYLSYNKTINKSHNFFLSAGMNMEENKYQEVIHYAEGFPSVNMDDILFALQYNATVMRPSGTSGFTRTLGFLAMLSYTYQDRFLFDGTYRLNASSVFGNSDRWAPFWSLGMGWNMHKEKFIKNLSWVKLLKIRTSIGSSGNQNFLNNKSLTINNYYTTDRYTNLIGSYATNMENPGLKWEQKMDYDAGIDADVYSLNIKFDIYKTITQNMVTSVSTVPSTGFTNVSANLGKVENKGIELTLSYTLFQNKNGFFRVNGSYTNNKNTILEISEAMRTFNAKQLATIDRSTIYPYIISSNTRPTILYYDGLPINTIWAVQSYGIDPATGIELLKGKNGESTYTWKPSDMVPSGISVPKWRGNFGFNGEYKGFGVSVTFTYLGGGQLYNQTLVDKIENINITSNFDRRVLTERWMVPDQMVQYKRNTGITPYDMRNGLYFYAGNTWNQEPTRPTQRFVQNQNELNISSVSLYYDFSRKWLSSFGCERLKFAAYMNDILKLSTIGIERGATYPFARTVSFSLTATF